MRLISVNTGRERTQPRGTDTEITGIYKLPAPGGGQINVLGIEGDFIGDHKHHGGVDQAVYVYGTRDYEWWKQELGRDLEPGTFGENLTISGLESAPLRIGDRLLIAGVTLEVSAPRIPCSTLARRMGDTKFALRFRQAERPGVYCRVIRPGRVQAGAPVLLQDYGGERLSVLEMFREHYERDKDEAVLQRTLRAPISLRARIALETQLQEVRNGGLT